MPLIPFVTWAPYPQHKNQWMYTKSVAIPRMFVQQKESILRYQHRHSGRDSAPILAPPLQV